MTDVPDMSWVQTGGLAAFAGLVYWELRLVRQVLAQTLERITRIEERDRLPPLTNPK